MKAETAPPIPDSLIASLDDHAIIDVANRAGQITYANDKFCQVSGYSRAELSGQSHRLINSGHHPKSFFDDLWKTISSGKRWHGEIRNRAKDGSHYWVEKTIFPCRDGQGRVSHYVAVGADNGDLSRREKKLAFQNQCFNAALDNMSQGLCMFDAEQNLIVANERYASMYGLAPEQMTPGTTLRQILEYRIANGIYAGENPEAYIKEQLEWVAIDVHSSKVQKLSNGRSIEISHVPMTDGGWLTTHEDITERRQSEEVLEQQAATVDLMNCIAVAANASTNARSTFEYCLSQICRFAGWKIGHAYMPAKDGTGKVCPTGYWFFSEKTQFATFREMTEMTEFECGQGLPGRVFEQQAASWVYDVTVDTNFPRGKIAKSTGIVGGAAFPIKVRDEVVAVLEFYSSDPMEPKADLVEVLNHVCAQMGWVLERERVEIELTAHRDNLQDLVNMATIGLEAKAEELRTALAAEKELNLLQRQFISMASHEFRTPLSIIDSSAQFLARKREQLTPDYVLSRTVKIRDAVKRMTRLMESTLTAARMEEGKIKVNIETCDIGRVVTEACARQQEISKNHVIVCNVMDLPETIQADPSSMDLVLTNLLSNAVKYAPDTPDIDVVARALGDEIEISVRDRGLGIDEADRPNMFERFFRAKTSTGIEGTGIGLNLAKSLIEMHGGSIAFASRKGEGSTFTVRLPVAGPAKTEQPGTRAA